jgi:hypothetical protein
MAADWTPNLIRDLNNFLVLYNAAKATDYELYATRPRHRGLRFGRWVYDCVCDGHLPAWPG